jgi:adenosylhomocysteine nucleosidase
LLAGLGSSDEDIVESARRERVREFTGALASAWEGAGGARASQFSGVPFVEVRGISDQANETAGQDFEENLQSTMRNVASVIIALARERLD